MILNWNDFKNLLATKMLLIQYYETSQQYNIFAIEGIEKYEAVIIKNASTSGILGIDIEAEEANQIDFETNYKDNANQPLTVKAAPGRPERVTASPQPTNTLEKWQGFSAEIAGEDSSGTLDIEFDSLVYLKGGIVICSDAVFGDSVKADVVLKSSPTTVITPNLLKDIPIVSGIKIDFMSSECMLFPSSVMLRVTYTKKTGDANARHISVIADLFS